MFGNGFRARVGAEFFAASSSEFQWYCLPSAYVVLHDSMLVRCAFVHYGRLARVHACVVLKGTTCSLSLSSGMPSLPLSCSGLSSSAMTPSWPAAFGLLSPSRWPQRFFSVSCVCFWFTCLDGKVVWPVTALPQPHPWRDIVPSVVSIHTRDFLVRQIDGVIPATRGRVRSP